jgi:hypothetical protein
MDGNTMRALGPAALAAANATAICADQSVPLPVVPSLSGTTPNAER